MRTHRHYRQSSSFKVATLFACLLAVAILSFGWSIYLLSTQLHAVTISKTVILLSIISIISLLLLAVFGYAISLFVVSRINRISDTAQQIVATGDLTKRLNIDSKWDDLSFLAEVLNQMLAKIENLMQGVQHITDTIAHDLRTPLARVRNRLEQDQQLGNSNIPLIHEVDALLATFNSLLKVSSLESGRQGLTFETLKLDQVARDAIELYQPLVENKSQTLHIDLQPSSLTGDRDLLFQVFTNLLDNAIKFTPEGGTINIATQQRPESVSFTISDSGPGISPQYVEKVFERFFRAHDTQGVTGSGLGLSLVKAVVKLHHATIELSSNQPGLVVVVTFPNSSNIQSI